MPAPGRKPKPTNLRIIEGNREHRPLNANEPKPQPVAPKKPPFVKGKAAKAWKTYAPKLERLGLLTEIDGPAFAALCLEYANYVEYRTGNYPKTQVYESGASAVTPEVTLAQKALDNFRALLTEFGMTPSSRSRIDLKSDEADEFGDLL